MLTRCASAQGGGKMNTKQRGGRSRGWVLFLAFFAGALEAGDARAVQVPLGGCMAAGPTCAAAAGEPSHGPTPANWEAAAQLFCSRFAAAHFASGNCPCD